MPKYTSGGVEQDIDPENEAAFEAAGWSCVEDPKPGKPDKPHPAE